MTETEHKHKHTWKRTAHLDGCHYYTNSYVCTECHAAATTSHERAPSDDLYVMVWMKPDCDRCTELKQGAPVRCDFVIVTRDGQLEHEEHTEREQQEESNA